MSKSLGPNTKAAITRLVDVLPHLHSDSTAVPTAQRGFWGDIMSRYASKHAGGGPTDPKVEAARAYAEEELSKALEEDEKTENEESEKTAQAEPLPLPERELTEEELERATRPEPAEGE